MSKPTRIALVGATGLIGMSLIRLAVHRPEIRIIAISLICPSRRSGRRRGRPRPDKCVLRSSAR